MRHRWRGVERQGCVEASCQVSERREKGILARLRDTVARMVKYFKNRGDKEGVRRMKAADKLLAEFESALKEGVAPEQVKPEDILEVLSPEVSEWYAQLGGTDVRRI